MYELKKVGKVFTSKFVGTGPSSCKKKNLPGRGLTKVEKHWSRRCQCCKELILTLRSCPSHICCPLQSWFRPLV